MNKVYNFKRTKRIGNMKPINRLWFIWFLSQFSITTFKTQRIVFARAICVLLCVIYCLTSCLLVVFTGPNLGSLGEAYPPPKSKDHEKITHFTILQITILKMLTPQPKITVSYQKVFSTPALQTFDCLFSPMIVGVIVLFFKANPLPRQ